MFNAKNQKVKEKHSQRTSKPKQIRSKSTAHLNKPKKQKKRICKDNYISNQIRGYVKKSFPRKNYTGNFRSEYLKKNIAFSQEKNGFEVQKRKITERNTVNESYGPSKQNLRKTLREILNEKITYTEEQTISAKGYQSQKIKKKTHQGKFNNSVGYFSYNNKQGEEKGEAAKSFDNQRKKIIELMDTGQKSRSRLDSTRYDIIFKESAVKRNQSQDKLQSAEKNFQKLLNTPTLNTDRYLHFKNNYTPKGTNLKGRRKPVLLASNFPSSNQITRDLLNGNSSIKIASLGKDFGVLDSDSEDGEKSEVEENKLSTPVKKPSSISYKSPLQAGSGKKYYQRNSKKRRSKGLSASVNRTSSTKKERQLSTKRRRKYSENKSVKFAQDTGEKKNVSIYIEDQFSLKSNRKRGEREEPRASKILDTVEEKIENSNNRKKEVKTATISEKRSGFVEAFAVHTIYPQKVIPEQNHDRLAVYFNSRTIKAKIKNSSRKKWDKKKERYRVPISFFGLYTSKNSNLCAEFMKKNLHHQIFKNRNFPRDVTKAIKEGVKETEEAFRNWFLGKTQKLEKGEEMESGESRANILITFGKFLSLLIMFLGKQAFTVMVGDNSVFLSQNGGKRYKEVRNHVKSGSKEE